MVKPRKSPQSSQRTRGASRYKRSETSRLLRGAIDAGLTVRGLEVDPATGTLRLLFDSAKGKSDDAEVEQWLSKQDAHKR
jgi:hypothetical protein